MSERQFSRFLVEVVPLMLIFSFLGALAFATLWKSGTIDPEVKGWIGGLMAAISMRGIGAAWDTSRNRPSVTGNGDGK